MSFSVNIKKVNFGFPKNSRLKDTKRNGDAFWFVKNFVTFVNAEVERGEKKSYVISVFIEKRDEGKRDAEKTAI